MYQVVLEALEKSIDAIEVGMTGKEIFYLTCDVMESHGFDTKRGGKKIKRGFLHGTGHGVGLAVHEPPVLTETGREALEEHNVVAVEPGLYDPAIGGVRIEDLGVVRKGGFEKLTSAKRVLEV
jgi:Xaa-Pro aminopeptidase